MGRIDDKTGLIFAAAAAPGAVFGAMPVGVAPRRLSDAVFGAALAAGAAFLMIGAKRKGVSRRFFKTPWFIVAMAARMRSRTASPWRPQGRPAVAPSGRRIRLAFDQGVLVLDNAAPVRPAR